MVQTSRYIRPPNPFTQQDGHILHQNGVGAQIAIHKPYWFKVRCLSVTKPAVTIMENVVKKNVKMLFKKKSLSLILLTMSEIGKDSVRVSRLTQV